MGDRVAVLRGGALQQLAAPQELYEQPANLFVASFIGSPAMNLYEATVSGPADRLVLSLGSQQLRLPADLARRRPGFAAAEGRKLVAGIRPENLTVAPPGATRELLPRARSPCRPSSSSRSVTSRSSTSRPMREWCATVAASLPQIRALGFRGHRGRVGDRGRRTPRPARPRSPSATNSRLRLTSIASTSSTPRPGRRSEQQARRLSCRCRQSPAPHSRTVCGLAEGGSAFCLTCGGCVLGDRGGSDCRRGGCMATTFQPELLSADVKTAEPAVRVRGLRKAYGALEAVRGDRLPDRGRRGVRAARARTGRARRRRWRSSRGTDRATAAR